MFDYVALFSNLPKEIATMLIAMLPIAELRLSIPIALEVYKLPIVSSYFYSVIGNIIPAIFILLLLEPVSSSLMNHSKLMGRFFTWLFHWTRNRHWKKFEVWGALALITFVAIPLPLTGAWSGSLAAFVFGVSFWKALLYISIGVLIAGLIVTLMTLGVFNFIK